MFECLDTKQQTNYSRVHFDSTRKRSATAAHLVVIDVVVVIHVVVVTEWHRMDSVLSLLVFVSLTACACGAVAVERPDASTCERRVHANCEALYVRRASCNNRCARKCTRVTRELTRLVARRARSYYGYQCRCDAGFEWNGEACAASSADSKLLFNGSRAAHARLRLELHNFTISAWVRLAANESGAMPRGWRCGTLLSYRELQPGYKNLFQVRARFHRRSYALCTVSVFPL